MELREQLEKLLEKSLNKKNYKCPNCQESQHWKYSGRGDVEGKPEPIYQCLDCQTPFYYMYLKYYNHINKDVD